MYVLKVCDSVKCLLIKELLQRTGLCEDGGDRFTCGRYEMVWSERGLNQMVVIFK